MQMKFFSIPVSGESSLVDELNKFLRNHRVISVQKEITQRETSPCWRICAEYLETPSGSEKSHSRRSSRIDYKEILSEEDFAVFSRLRKLRKFLAEKGLDPAIERARRFSINCSWFLKMDIRKYFDSIDHEILKIILRRKFKDDILLNLFYQIIDGYFKAPGKGVPIGNLTSQYFANHYLALLDHYIKEELRCGFYVRYMDDFVVWRDSREDLKMIHKKVEAFLKENLSLELKPECLNRSEKGLKFLGYRIFPLSMKLSRRSRDRFRKKIRIYHEKYERGEWTEEETSRHVEPLLSFVKRADSEGYRRRLLINMGLCPKA